VNVDDSVIIGTARVPTVVLTKSEAFFLLKNASLRVFTGFGFT